MNRLGMIWMFGFVLVATMGCSDRSRTRTRLDGSVSDAISCMPGGPTMVCAGTTLLQCSATGTETSRTDCAASGQVCAPSIGCSNCVPNGFSCDGGTILQCNGDGTSASPTGTVCDVASGQTCDPQTGTCRNLCAEAASSNSYIGCEYYAVTAINAVRPEFLPAIVVSNPQTGAANVTVSGPNGFSQSRTVAPGAVDTISLPWVAALGAAEASALVSNGAYHVRSTVPVTVYQFNPLEYRLPMDCAGECPADDPGCAEGNDGQCFSYSNDASLLLPVHVLTGNYLAVSRPAMHMRQTQTIVDVFTGAEVVPTEVSESVSPGFIAIVGAGTSASDVTITHRAFVTASASGSVSAQSPGSVSTHTLQPGDVLQLVTETPTGCTPTSTDTEEVCFDSLGQPVSSCSAIGAAYRLNLVNEYCQVGADYDLTGTDIRSTGKIMVLNGHACAFVPANRWACDHLEESAFPLDAWGKDFVVGATQPLRGEPNVVRILSGGDNNALTFDPASVHAPVTLARGEYIEFETGADFRVVGTAALSVTQFLVGQNYSGFNGSDTMGNGDPAMSFAIPTEQFRSEYSFLAPSSYEQSWVNVTAPVGATVTLRSNGGIVTEVSGWRAVGGSGMQTARVQIPAGSHEMRSSSPFGIVVYGFGSYTSYMYPGGLDFERINLI